MAGGGAGAHRPATHHDSQAAAALSALPERQLCGRPHAGLPHRRETQVEGQHGEGHRDTFVPGLGSVVFVPGYIQYVQPYLVLDPF